MSTIKPPQHPANLGTTSVSVQKTANTQSKTPPRALDTEKDGTEAAHVLAVDHAPEPRSASLQAPHGFTTASSKKPSGPGAAPVDAAGLLDVRDASPLPSETWGMATRIAEHPQGQRRAAVEGVLENFVTQVAIPPDAASVRADLGDSRSVPDLLRLAEGVSTLHDRDRTSARAAKAQETLVLSLDKMREA